MAKLDLQDHRAYAAAILARLKGSTPPALRPGAAQLRAAHAAFLALADRAEQARGARDRALHEVGAADDALDASIEALAVALIAAGAARSKPFGAYTKLSPSALAYLAYAEEVKAATALAKAVVADEPAPAVKKAATEVQKRAAAVTAALAALTKPQATYAKALGARDAALPELERALRRLKRQAAAAFDEDRAGYAALFASVLPVQAPKKKRAKKPAPKPAS